MSIRKASEIKLKHIPQFLFLALFAALFRIVPMSWLYAFCLPLSRLLIKLDKKHRGICSENLSFAFPEKTKEEIRTLVNGVYLNMTYIFFEFLQLDKFFTTPKVNHLFDINNFSLLDRLLEKKKGIIVITTHLGNWELEGGLTCHLKYKLNAIYFPQTNPLADTFFNRTRNKVGINLIPNTVAVKKTIEHLRKNELVAFLSDQDARGGNVFVDFFGRKAATVKGPIFFALKTGAPVILAGLIRKPGNKFLLNIEEVPIIRTDDLENDILTNTQTWSTMLENLIRKHPEQWFWVHRRWKTRPDGEST